MGLAVLLPYIRSIKIGKEGVEATVDRAAAATKKAFSAAGVEATPPPPATAGHLEVATNDPLASLETSRRALASSLAELAAANGIKQAGTIEELARSLEGEGPTRLNSKTREAVTELAELIKDAKAKSRASPGLALEVDYGTQFLTSEFRKRAAAAKITPQPESTT